ncbi:MAG: gluconokinase [Akkermansiaceae bacterium]|jgi:carbohydrate kinase (thermoresistant glucokinase family)|nr:gluconokinase [Akkermansiaceae bacterium]
MKDVRVIIIMGVAGAGKSTVGAHLAQRLGGCFHDADAYHPPGNIAKMASGQPLNDQDRAPWLKRMREEVVDPAPPGKLALLACSALKAHYRKQLGLGTPGVALVYLKGDSATLQRRLELRESHFMKSGMLASQLATLEEPADFEGITVSIEGSLEQVLDEICARLGLHAV